MRGDGLSADEREVISRELAQDKSYRDIGRLLDRNHTVISREVNNNGGRTAYRAIQAQRRSDRCRTRPKSRLLEMNKCLHDVVAEGLEKKWSPRQIGQRLREDFPEDDTMKAFGNSIYA